MPVAQIFALPAPDGTDGTGQQPPSGDALIPWIALTVALTAIACVWLGRASVPFMLGLAAWAGLALARQRGDAPLSTITPATPTAPHIRLVATGRAAASRAAPRSGQRPAPVLRLVARPDARAWSGS